MKSSTDAANTFGDVLEIYSNETSMLVFLCSLVEESPIKLYRKFYLFHYK